MASIIKKPRLAILGEFDGTDFVGELYERNGNDISGILNTNSEPHFDIIGFLNGYGSKSGKDLNSELTANKPAAYSTFTGGLDENGYFYLEADDDFQFGTFEDNRAKFGFTGNETTVETSGTYRLTAASRWQRGVFEIEHGGSNGKLGLSLSDVLPSTSYTATTTSMDFNSDTIKFGSMSTGIFNSITVGDTITNTATSHSATYSSSLDYPSIEFTSSFSAFRDQWSALIEDVTILEDPSGNEYRLKQKYYFNSKFYAAVERVGHTVTPANSTNYSWTHPDHQGGTVSQSHNSSAFWNTRQLAFPSSSLTQDDFDRLELGTTATDSNGNQQYIMAKIQDGSQVLIIARPIGTFTADSTLSWSGQSFEFVIRQKFTLSGSKYLTVSKTDHIFTPSNTESYRIPVGGGSFITEVSSELVDTSVLEADTSRITTDAYNSITAGEIITDDNGFTYEVLHKYSDGGSYRFIIAKPTNDRNTALVAVQTFGLSLLYTEAQLSDAAYNSLIVGTTVVKDNYFHYRVEHKEQITYNNGPARQIYLSALGHDNAISGGFNWTTNGTSYSVSHSSATASIELELSDLSLADFNGISTSDHIGVSTGGERLEYDATGQTTGANFSPFVYTVRMKYQKNGSYRVIVQGSNTQAATPKLIGTDGSGPPNPFNVVWGLSSSLNWTAFQGTLSQWDAIDTARRVQNLPTYIRVRGSVLDADDIYSGKCLEDFEHTAGNTLASLVLEEDGHVSINYPSSVSYDNVSSNTAAGKALLLRLGFDGTETETTTFGNYRQLKAANPAPCAMTSRGYVELRRETIGRDDFSIMADGSVISAGLAPIKGWHLLIRVTGPGHGYSANRERHLRDWWKHARRGLTIYPTFGDPDNNGDGGNDTRRHVNIETIYGTADRHTLFQTVEADESAHHYGKRVGGRLLVRRHPADAQERRESYSGNIDMHQDIRIRLLDDPTR